MDISTRSSAFCKKFSKLAKNSERRSYFDTTVYEAQNTCVCVDAPVVHSALLFARLSVKVKTGLFKFATCKFC